MKPRLEEDKTLKQRFLTMASICLLVSGALACQSASLRTESSPSTAFLGSLQGTWGGHGPGGPCTVTISGNVLHYTQPSNDPPKPGFWYRTSLELFPDSDPQQFHATILENIHDADIGTVVITLVKLEGERLTLGVVDHVKEPPSQPVPSDWDLVRDQYDLKKVDAGVK